MSEEGTYVIVQNEGRCQKIKLSSFDMIEICCSNITLFEIFFTHKSLCLPNI